MTNFLVLYTKLFVYPQGNFYEARGLSPDIHIPVITKENVFESHQEAVRAIVDRIGKR